MSASRPIFRRLSSAAILLAAAWPQTAAAHSVLGVSRWWDGALHFVLSPMADAAAIGAAAMLSITRQETAALLMFAFALGAFGGASVTPIPLAAVIAPAAAILAGSAAAFGWAPGRRWAAVALLLLGVSAGIAASPDEALTIEMAGGAAFAAVVLGANAQFVLAWIGGMERVIPRVLGAWCAAIGLMTGLLAVAS